MRTRIYRNEELIFFPFYTTTIEVDFAQRHIERPVGFEAHQLFLVNRGSGTLNINGKEYFLEKNDLFYISANTPHFYSPLDQDFSTSYISFLGPDFEKIKSYYNLKNYGVYKQKSKEKFLNAVKKLYNVFDAAHEVSHLCMLTFSVIITFFDEALKKQTSPIEKVHNYLESNYHKSIVLDDLLEFYPYSKAKLCRDFKNTYKISVFEAVLSIRLQHAHQMLTYNPHIKLKTIATSCGFNDTSYFCKMYKKKYGYSPKKKYKLTNCF